MQSVTPSMTFQYVDPRDDHFDHCPFSTNLRKAYGEQYHVVGLGPNQLIVCKRGSIQAVGLDHYAAHVEDQQTAEAVRRLFHSSGHTHRSSRGTSIQFPSRMIGRVMDILGPLPAVKHDVPAVEAAAESPAVPTIEA